MRRFLLLCFILLLGMSAVLSAKANPVTQLQKNIATWEQFRWQGIIQVQSSAFAIRKNFVLSKNKSALRLDILDSGIMGLTAKPLVTLYMRDTIILNAPSIKQLEGIDPNWFIPRRAVEGLVHFTDSLQAAQQEIIANRKLKSGKTLYLYDKKYRLTQIKSVELGVEANVTYNRRNQPTKVTVKYANEPLAELQINEREFDNIEIETTTQTPPATGTDVPQADNPKPMEQP
jgi:hypothetical protein